MIYQSGGSLPANYRDCLDLMCRSFRDGYQPTDAENRACSQLRGSFEGKSFSPYDCAAAPLTPAPQESAAIVTAPPTIGIKVASAPEYLAADYSFGWRIRQECYPRPTAESALVGCPSATWWYILLGIAALAGVSSRRR